MFGKVLFFYSLKQATNLWSVFIFLLRKVLNCCWSIRLKAPGLARVSREIESCVCKKSAQRRKQRAKGFRGRTTRRKGSWWACGEFEMCTCLLGFFKQNKKTNTHNEIIQRAKEKWGKTWSTSMLRWYNVRQTDKRKVGGNIVPQLKQKKHSRHPGFDRRPFSPFCCMFTVNVARLYSTTSKGNNVLSEAMHTGDVFRCFSGYVF